MYTFSARSNHIYQDQGAIMALAEAMRARSRTAPFFAPRFYDLHLLLRRERSGHAGPGNQISDDG